MTTVVASMSDRQLGSYKSYRVCVPRTGLTGNPLTVGCAPAQSGRVPRATHSSVYVIHQMTQTCHEATLVKPLRVSVRETEYEGLCAQASASVSVSECEA